MGLTQINCCSQVCDLYSIDLPCIFFSGLINKDEQMKAHLSKDIAKIVH